MGFTGAIPAHPARRHMTASNNGWQEKSDDEQTVQYPTSC
jgi:hypothetical protein